MPPKPEPRHPMGATATLSSSPHFYALVPCAGSGSRAGTSGPKQYWPLAGEPLVQHTLRALCAVDALRQVLLVQAPGDATRLLPHPKLRYADCGGATRADSVWAGLAVLSDLGAQDGDWVLVHDAARCLLRPQEVQALIAACADDPVGGLLALALPDTLKQGADGRVQATLAREDKWLAQTPQMFRLGTLRQALAAAQASGFAGITDEASAVERLGLRPRLVAGSSANFKVTYPADFALAEACLRSRT